MNNTIQTREGITVSVGQIWCDLDKRMDGRLREIVGIDLFGGYVVMKAPGALAPFRTTRVAIRRMHKHTTGWALVRQPASVGLCIGCKQEQGKPHLAGCPIEKYV